MHRPRRTRLVAAVAGVVAAAAIVATAGTGAASSPIRLRITLTTYTHFTQRHERTYTLNCDPTSGTLPLAGRICRDVARHPLAMLGMLNTGRGRSVCSPPAGSPEVAVEATRGSKHARFGDVPNCSWPGGGVLAVYYDAITKNEKLLASDEARLRCEDDPVLLATPKPWVSIEACLHGFWTPRNERLIRAAEQVPQLRALQPQRLFPRDVGVLPCRITVGGPTRRHITGKCGVSITHAWSTPTLVFTESWSGWSGPPYRHHWVVEIAHGHARLTAQSHGALPQLID